MTTETTEVHREDPTAKARLILGGVLLALAWLLAAAVVIGLLIVLPENHVRDYAWAVVLSGLFAAAGATYAVISDVING